jgi:hypothetical protein
MAEIVTGTVTGIVDTSGLTRDIADVRRETALEAGDIRRDVANEGRHTSDVVNSASNVGQRDASSFFIAEQLSATQTAKEIARSQAWTEAKIDANFQATTGQINLASAVTSGVTQLEAAKLQGAMALQHGVLTLQIAQDGATTRALINGARIDELRDVAANRYTKIVELEGDRKHCDRDYDRLSHSMQQNQWASLQNQLQAMNSDLQSTRQSVISFGTGSATGGATTSNIAH